MEDKMKHEIESLSGQALAFETMLFWLLFHIRRNNADPIKQALDDSANTIEAQTIAAGTTASPQHLAKALGIVEHFQKSIL